MVASSTLFGYGDILIGRLISNPHMELTLRRDDFIRHCLIVGTTGSGKTTTASVIASQLSPYGKVIILDWYFEFPQILSEFNVKFNIYSPAPSNQIPFIRNPNGMLAVLEDVLSLTPPQSFMLHRILQKPESLRSPSSLIAMVEEYEPSAKWMIESKYALIRKLESLFNGESLELFGSKFSNLTKSLFKEKEILIIDLTPFKLSKTKRLVCLLLLRLFENVKMLKKFNKKLFIVIDEAHNILTDGETLIDRLFAEVRKLGMGLILITQSPALLSYRVLTNSNIKIVHALKSRDDLETISKALGFIDGLHNVIPRLDVGEAVIDAPSLPKPEVVKVDLKLIRSRLSTS